MKWNVEINIRPNANDLMRLFQQISENLCQLKSESVVCFQNLAKFMLKKFQR